MRLSNQGAFRVEASGECLQLRHHGRPGLDQAGHTQGVQLVVPGAVLTLPASGSVEVSLSSGSDVPGASLTARKGTLLLHLAGSDDTLQAGDQVTVRSDSAQPEKTSVGDADAWEAWNQRWDVPGSLPSVSIR